MENTCVAESSPEEFGVPGNNEFDPETRYNWAYLAEEFFRHTLWFVNQGRLRLSVHIKE